MRVSLFGLIVIALVGAIAAPVLAMRHQEVQRLVAFQQVLAGHYHLPLGPDKHHWGEYSRHGSCGRSAITTSPLLLVHDLDLRIATVRSATTITELYSFYQNRARRQSLLEEFPLALSTQPTRDAGPYDSELNQLTVRVLRREILRIPAGEALAWSSPLRKRQAWNSPTTCFEDIADWWTLPAELTRYLQWLADLAERTEAGERLTNHELSSPPTGMRMMGAVSPPSTAILNSLFR